MRSPRTFVEQHEDQGVALGIDGGQGLRAGRRDDVVAPLDEA